MVIGIAFMLNWPLPLLPLHILFLRPGAAVTAFFLTPALAQLWHVFHMRDQGSSIFRNDITTNRYVWHALCLCVALILAAVWLRGISFVLKLSNPSVIVWLVALGLSLVPVVFRILLGDRREQKAELSLNSGKRLLCFALSICFVIANENPLKLHAFLHLCVGLPSHRTELFQKSGIVPIFNQNFEVCR